MLTVQEKPLLILIEDDLETLMHAHWKECSIHQEEVPFDPDWLMALAMEKCGVLRAFGLYRGGVLAGYAVFEVAPHLHFKSTKFAFASGIYVKPECRGFAGAVLVDGAEKALKELGVKKITYTAPHRSVLNMVLGKAGYMASETYYTKLTG